MGKAPARTAAGVAGTGPARATRTPQRGTRSPVVAEYFCDDFARGVMVGAATTYFLTNPQVQKAAMATAVRVWDAVQGGFSELRERFHDAEAEIHGGSKKPEDT